MKKFILFGLFLLMSCGTEVAYKAATLDEAQKLSAEHNKPILIDFMTEW